MGSYRLTHKNLGWDEVNGNALVKGRGGAEQGDYEVLPVTEVAAVNEHGLKIGYAEFAEYEGKLVPSWVLVDEDHRRQGIASAIYDYATKTLGKPLCRNMTPTPEGQAFADAYHARQRGEPVPDVSDEVMRLRRQRRSRMLVAESERGRTR